jgi:hypothetical protein
VRGSRLAVGAGPVSRWDLLRGQTLGDQELGATCGRELAACRREIGAESAQTRIRLAGIVALEGGGTAPHPMGGGARSRWNRRDPERRR